MANSEARTDIVISSAMAQKKQPVVQKEQPINIKKMNDQFQGIKQEFAGVEKNFSHSISACEKAASLSIENPVATTCKAGMSLYSENLSLIITITSSKLDAIEQSIKDIEDVSKGTLKPNNPQEFINGKLGIIRENLHDVRNVAEDSTKALTDVKLNNLEIFVNGLKKSWNELNDVLKDQQGAKTALIFTELDDSLKDLKEGLNDLSERTYDMSKSIPQRYK